MMVLFIYVNENLRNEISRNKRNECNVLQHVQNKFYECSTFNINIGIKTKYIKQVITKTMENIITWMKKSSMS